MPNLKRLDCQFRSKSVRALRALTLSIRASNLSLHGFYCRSKVEEEFVLAALQSKYLGWARIGLLVRGLNGACVDTNRRRYASRSRRNQISVRT